MCPKALQIGTSNGNTAGGFAAALSVHSRRNSAIWRCKLLLHFQEKGYAFSLTNRTIQGYSGHTNTLRVASDYGNVVPCSFYAKSSHSSREKAPTPGRILQVSAKSLTWKGHKRFQKECGARKRTKNKVPSQVPIRCPFSRCQECF